MRRLEKTLNAYPQYTCAISNVSIHFLHVKSSRRDAMPLLLVHGWPGSVLEFRHIIDPLTNPPKPTDQAFHLVIPSIPGYGFSGVPSERGWSFIKVAEAFAELMTRLGYSDGEGYVAQGGDWGADIVAEMGRAAFPGLRAVHMNTAFFESEAELFQSRQGDETLQPLNLRDAPVDAAAEKALRLSKYKSGQEDGYTLQQATRPQTLGYGLADSPVGQLAWIYEKIVVWADSEAGPKDREFSSPLPIDEVLDNVMLYWVTNSGASSARMYWESEHDTTAVKIPKEVAVGVSLFAADIHWGSRAWGERYYRRLVHWNEVGSGGHFGAWERPHLLVREIQDFYKKI